MVEARLAAAAAVVVLAVTRDGDDDGVLAMPIFPENRRDLVAVHAGQPDVEENELRPEGLRRFDGRLAMKRHLDVVAQKPEQPGQAPRRIDIVIDDKDA